jgi:hypothetical protein
MPAIDRVDECHLSLVPVLVGPANIRYRAASARSFTC